MNENTSENIDLDNREFQQVWKLINYTRQSIFMTGKAGSGKSTFMRYITAHTKKKHVVLAPTGIAAVNAGGSTLHSFFRIPLKPILPDDPDFAISRLRERMKYPAALIKLIRSLELIVIDEISMVRADIIDFVDKLLRVYSGNMREPFGGKQLLLVGDIFQLEPVVTSDARDLLRHHYPNLYFFSAMAFARIGIVPIELRKIYRQRDSNFVEMLDRIRVGAPSLTDLRILNSRVISGTAHADGDFVMTLATQRDMVDSINEYHLSKIASPMVTYHGVVEGTFPESSMPTPIELSVKAGAQVVFIRNDRERRWVNGTIGKIFTAQNNLLEVELENGDRHIIEPERWSNVRYDYNEDTHRIDEVEIGAYIQYPIRLAWALTIHKSQGLTFNNVIIDLGRGAFSSGQTYVALSRCRSLQGMTLRSTINARDIFVSPALSEFSRNYNNPMLLQRALEIAKADDCYHQASLAWDNGDIRTAVEQFAKAVSARNELNDPVVVRLIRKKMSVVDDLRDKIVQLENIINQQRQMLDSLAGEYVTLGYSCLEESNDLHPALANFEKALRINPGMHDALQGKATALLEMGETEAAIDAFLHLSVSQPDDFTVQFTLGDLYFATGEIHESLNRFLIAEKLEKKNPRVHDRLADIYDQIGDESEARMHRTLAAKLRKRRR